MNYKRAECVGGPLDGKMVDIPAGAEQRGNDGTEVRLVFDDERPNLVAVYSLTGFAVVRCDIRWRYKRIELKPE